MPLTKETWFNGDLAVYQPLHGYRYSIDPIILCSVMDSIIPDFPGQILDIGCGCGIMPLLMAYRNPEAHITGVEIQEELAAIALWNAEKNRFGHRIRIISQDINTLNLKDIRMPAELIVANPPYKKRGTGRLNPHKGRALARHEITLTIDQLFASASPLLSREGRICVIFPADRLDDLESAARKSGFFVEWLCHIVKTAGDAPFRVVVSAVKNPKASRDVLPPFVLYDTGGNPTKMHKALFSP